MASWTCSSDALRAPSFSHLASCSLSTYTFCKGKKRIEERYRGGKIRRNNKAQNGTSRQAKITALMAVPNVIPLLGQDQQECFLA